MSQAVNASTFRDILSEVEITAGKTTSRIIHDDDDLKVVVFGFAAGEGLPEHSAAFPAVLHFLDGEASVTLGGETISATANTLAHMPARLPHSITAKQDTKMMLSVFKRARSS